MNILVNGTHIVTIGEEITFGVFDEPFEKWKIKNNGFVEFYIDDGYQMIEGVDIPEDYIHGKYFYENGEFVLNTEWQPYYSIEERVTMLEDENKRLSLENEESVEHEAELLYELSLLKLGIEY